MSRPDVTVIIPAYGKPELTRMCLDSLFAVPAGAAFEVVVVDNASPPGLDAVLDAFAGRIEVRRNSVNVGFSRACNQGASGSPARYLLFLNNDIEAHPGWLAPLVNALDADPAVGMAGSKLLYPDGRVQHAGVAVARYEAYPDGLAPFHIYRGDSADEPWVNRERDLQAVTAACCLVRREVFEALGGFDPAYWNGFEDVDLCFRILRQGHRIRYVPASVLTHHESMGGKERFIRASRNVELLNRRWGGRIRPDDNRVYLEDGRLMRWKRDGAGATHDVLEVGCTSVLVVSPAPGPAAEAAAVRVARCTRLPHEVQAVNSHGGLARALNGALRRARSSRIAFLDSSVELQPGWLEPLLGAVAEIADVGMAGPRMPAPDGPQRLPGDLANLAGPGPGKPAGALARDSDASNPDVPVLRPECVLVQASVFERVGEFDEELPDAAVWPDLCLRAREAGFRLRVATDARAHTSQPLEDFRDAGAERAFERKWGVTPGDYFELGHHPLRRVPETPEAGDPSERALLREASRALEAGDRHAALAALAQAHSLRPESGEVHFLLGILQCNDGELDAAAAEFRQAVAAAPRSERALAHLAEVLRIQGRNPEAIAAYGRILELNPQDAGTLVSMSTCLAAVGRAEMARDCLRLASAYAPRDSELAARIQGLAVRSEFEMEAARERSA